MEYSNLEFNARDIDSKKGIVSFYFADFNSVDSHGRRINKNAFNRTFNNNFKRFAHLLNHDPNIIIGKPLEVNTDEKGAFMVSQLSKSSHGRDALVQYEEGIYNEHSFGFMIPKNGSVMDGKVEVVNELQMFEASTVTWGANEHTPTISLNDLTKYMETKQDEKGIIEKIDFLIEKMPFDELTKYKETLDNMLKDFGSLELIMNRLDEIQARLPVPAEHQASQRKHSIEEIIKIINAKY